jgi:hypothetical protein
LFFFGCLIHAHATQPLTADRNIQSIKDLKKPWATLTPQLSTSPVLNRQSKLEPSLQTSMDHSAMMTILLDESPTKAVH